MGNAGMETDDVPATIALRPLTLAYLDALAAAAFKRQEDLDESVWRSLPFFAAAFALATTIVATVAGGAPLPAWDVFAIIVNAVLAAALASFAWALRWFYEVLRPRIYDYPPGTHDVREFAELMTAYYLEQDEAKTDAAVTDELRQMMIAAHATATRTNFLLNETRLEARGQLTLFLMLGFLMTLATETIIYGHTMVTRITVQEGSSNGRGIPARNAANQRRGREAGRSEGLLAGAGREILPLEHHTQTAAEAVTGKPPIQGQPSATAKPSPPPLQPLKKTEDGPPLRR